MFLLHRTSDLLRKDPPDLRGALAECNAAVREDSSNPEVLRIYGCFLSNVGQRKAAQQQFEAALAVDPTSDVVILSYSELLLAGVEDATDDREGRGKSASELQVFLKDRSTTRLQHLHHAQHLLERLLEIADTRPEVQARVPRAPQGGCLRTPPLPLPPSLIPHFPAHFSGDAVRAQQLLHVFV